MSKYSTLTRLIIICVITMFFSVGYVSANETVVKTLLAKRGKLILDDNGSQSRGGDIDAHFEDGIFLRAKLGIWNRSTEDKNVWRSTFKEGMGHPPVAGYKNLKANNLIVEVTFRWGEITEPWQNRFIRIAADQRPQRNGHIVSAWANTNSRYTQTGLVLEHVDKAYKGNNSGGVLMDHQPLAFEVNNWYTAVLEIVDDETLFRLEDQVAYAQLDAIANGPKNTVSLTLGTTWHEIKRVRIWHAEANPDWEVNKQNILKSRQPFAQRPK